MMQIGPASVRVPARMMLNLLLEQLNIPDTIYRGRQYSQDSHCHGALLHLYID